MKGRDFCQGLKVVVKTRRRVGEEGGDFLPGSLATMEGGGKHYNHTRNGVVKLWRSRCMEKVGRRRREKKKLFPTLVRY
jgi:hypothetical protein